MKNRIEFNLFRVRLAVSLVIFVFRLSVAKAPKTVILATFLSIFGGFLLLFTITSKPEVVTLQPPIIKSSPPPHSELYSLRNFSESELQNELEFWLNIETHQPTHRDVLVNIALLYQAQGNQEKYNEYWQKARYIDPNHQLFQE